MAKFQLVLSDPETGQAHIKILEGAPANTLIGKNIGEKIAGGQLGFPGYSFHFTGGTDKDGFPMRPDLPGGRKWRILVKKGGVGFRPKQKSIRKKRTFRGRMISEDTYQVNFKIIKKGKKSLVELIAGIAE